MHAIYPNSAISKSQFPNQEDYNFILAIIQLKYSPLLVAIKPPTGAYHWTLCVWHAEFSCWYY